MFHTSQYNPNDAPALAAFLNDLRQNHWSLTSLAHSRQPDTIPLATPDELTQAEEHPNRIGTFLLKYSGRIISILQIDDKYGDGKIAIFSGVETHPDYQRRGTFWRYLLIPCFRQLSTKSYQRFEAITWPLNRKGIPLYKRIGFRTLPRTSIVMENYIPLILKHPDAHNYFTKHDYIRTLQNKRSYGHDSISTHRANSFKYIWTSKGDRLSVYIDWHSKRITDIQYIEAIAICENSRKQ